MHTKFAYRAIIKKLEVFNLSLNDVSDFYLKLIWQKHRCPQSTMFRKWKIVHKFSDCFEQVLLQREVNYRCPALFLSCRTAGNFQMGRWNESDRWCVLVVYCRKYRLPSSFIALDTPHHVPPQTLLEDWCPNARFHSAIMSYDTENLGCLLHLTSLTSSHVVVSCTVLYDETFLITPTKTSQWLESGDPSSTLRPDSTVDRSVDFAIFYLCIKPDRYWLQHFAETMFCSVLVTLCWFLCCMIAFLMQAWTYDAVV